MQQTTIDAVVRRTHQRPNRTEVFRFIAILPKLQQPLVDKLEEKQPPMKPLFSVLMAITCISCHSASNPNSADVSDVVIEQYSSGGTVAVVNWSNMSTEESRSIKAWLESMSGKMETSFITYAPKIVLRTHAWNVNFLESIIVVNFIDGNGACRQRTRTMTEKDVKIRDLIAAKLSSAHS